MGVVDYIRYKMSRLSLKYDNRRLQNLFRIKRKQIHMDYGYDSDIDYSNQNCDVLAYVLIEGSGLSKMTSKSMYDLIQTCRKHNVHGLLYGSGDVNFKPTCDTLAPLPVKSLDCIQIHDYSDSHACVADDAARDDIRFFSGGLSSISFSDTLSFLEGHPNTNPNKKSQYVIISAEEEKAYCISVKTCDSQTAGLSDIPYLNLHLLSETIKDGASVKDCYDEMCNAVNCSIKDGHRMVIIGARLEDLERDILFESKCGFRTLNLLSQAMLDRPYSGQQLIIEKNPDNHNIPPLIDEVRIAVHAHVFYTNLLSEIIECTNRIPAPFDLILTTDSVFKKDEILRNVGSSRSRNVRVSVCENRGRDVAPFLFEMTKCHLLYDYICHIHTKKTEQTIFGDEWRKYLYDNLLPSEDGIKSILSMFESIAELGLVYPAPFFAISDNMWLPDPNQPMTLELLERMGLHTDISSRGMVYPAGTMFWIRAKALEPLIELDLSTQDFPPEGGQFDGTLAHAIERVLCYMVSLHGYTWVNCNVHEPVVNVGAAVVDWVFDKKEQVLGRK